MIRLKTLRREFWNGYYEGLQGNQPVTSPPSDLLDSYDVKRMCRAAGQERGYAKFQYETRKILAEREQADG